MARLAELFGSEKAVLRVSLLPLVRFAICGALLLPGARPLLAQDVLSFGRAVDRTAPVAGSLVSIVGDVRLAAPVARDLIVLGGDVTLAPGAKVEGDLLVLGGTAKGADLPAQVAGEVHTLPALETAFLAEVETSPVARGSAVGLLLSLRIALLAIWLVAGSLLLFLAPRRVLAAAETSHASTPLDAILGAIGLLSAILLSAFFLSVLPARPALVLMGLVALLVLAAKAFGLTVLCLRIGRRLAPKARRGTLLWGDPAALSLGLALLGVASLVPFAGRIVWMAASLVAVGVALGSGFGKPLADLTLSERRA